MSSEIVEIPKPPAFNYPQAATALIAPVAFIVLIVFTLSVPTTAVAILLPGYVAIPLVLDLVIGVALLVYAYRAFWKWRHEPDILDPDTGKFVRVSVLNTKLLIFGSPDDPTETDGAKIETPGSKFVSEHFNSATLVIDGKTFTHVRNIQHVLDIIAYRASLKSRNFGSEQRQERLLEGIYDRLGQILTVLTPPVAVLPAHDDNIDEEGDITVEAPASLPPPYRVDPWP
jgi:hypothetical protein